MKFEIFKFATVTSTNDIAMNMIKKKENKSGCICAEEQLNGRGNHGRKWISCKGNLFSSIFFPLEKNYPSFDEFSIINPVIILNSIKHLFKKKNISFKWPNDILVNEKKICGIL